MAYRDEFASDDTPRPDVLVCAGLDPSGGAGLIADARVIAELGGRPVGIVTTLTVQNTAGVLDGHVVDPEVVRTQLECLLSDVEVRAVKLGMLGSAEVARAIAVGLALTGAPVVWDPVIYPSRGELPRVDVWIADALVALIPHVTLMTPNARELEILTGAPVSTVPEMIAAARRITRKLNVAVLVKGGHLGGDESVDVLLEGESTEVLRAPRIPDGHDVHGTGCALSSAIATHLALGHPLLEAVRAAKLYVASRIAHPAVPGRGARAIV
ncbi:MAG: hydroxymethylpyrimidine/phosphomethylpyrimidine kinase [Deltaproteobacteria bacterium]|nr:hydroxymethylpyrimidine/phosphomethylpyrimidine kinase [Deltaproteobacteria bacterium]